MPSLSLDCAVLVLPSEWVHTWVRLRLRLVRSLARPNLFRCPLSRMASLLRLDDGAEGTRSPAAYALCRPNAGSRDRVPFLAHLIMQ